MLKKIASNTLAQLVAKFVGAGLTFLTTALIIRLAGPSIFGDLTKSLVLIAIGFTVIDFGLNAVVVRQIGRAGTVGTRFADLLFTRLILSALLVVALNILVYLMPSSYSDQIKSVFWIGSLAIIFQGIYTSCNAIFQSQENYWRSTLSTVIGTTLGAGLTYYFILTSPTLFHFLLANTLGYLTMATCSLLLISPPPSSLRYSIFDILVLFKKAIPLGAILLASVAASKFDTIILGVYRASSEVGQYGFAYRIFDVLLVFPSFLMNAVYPKLVNKNTQDSSLLIRRINVFMFVSGLVLTIITWCFAPLISLIRPELNLSILALRLLSLSLPIFFLTSPLMWFEISRNRERRILNIYLSAALINSTLNLIFIPSYGAPAAAIITGVTEMCILLSLLYFSHIKIKEV